MADETEPLIEKQRTYDPTEDPVVQTTEEAYEIHTQYITDLLNSPGLTVRRTKSNSECEISVSMDENVMTHDLADLLAMDGVRVESMCTPGTDVDTSFNALFVVEDGFYVPIDYQPSGPDEDYIQWLFETSETTVETDKMIKVYTDTAPTQQSLTTLEGHDEYELDNIDYREDDDYIINVRWLATEE